jgi:valyl-tRNA synthetase
MVAVPERPSLDGLETRWDAAWEASGTYRFDRSASRDQVYAIDCPPPTISGQLHLGSVFGYMQTDAIARFQRMRGREVFYVMGWDDNGLPTERRVQNHFGVLCDPSLPYDPDLSVTPGGDTAAASRTAPRPVSRRNFVELCHELTEEFEKSFEDQWRRLGLSVDWSQTYTTIGEPARRLAQRAFLHNLARGEAYARQAPTMWDVDFQTAVAQAEFEDREVPGFYHRLAFTRARDGSTIAIDTTRPELLPACVALVAHPDDTRYADLVGEEALTPIFGNRVPVLAHPQADPERGTGIAMICTFGDAADVQWWRDLDLPMHAVVQRDGRLQQEVPDWLTRAGAQAWDQLGGRTTTQARRALVSMLQESGALLGEPRRITHAVKFYEKGERPLEIVTSRQWYIRNGARDDDLRAVLIERGRELRWHPDFMRVRYEHWVDGLTTDWLISRQRYFGVPFPVWYPVDAAGEVRWEDPILSDEAALPVDPASDAPPGYEESQRGRPGGFVGDPDVMDTWATSSLSPQLVCGWVEDPDLFARTFPMDLRPQGPEIIRTWLFASVLRAQAEHGCLPWSNAIINGWILDPDRKKMSKSLGNVATPMPLAEQYGADGVRYWACRAAPGTDTAADPQQMRVGRRLALKLLNASKFVLGLGPLEEPAANVVAPIDRAMLAQLAAVVDDATEAFESYQYHRALDRTEAFFWHFCDDYLELVKNRAYGNDSEASSASASLSMALSVLLRLFAPFLPFATEEVWSWWRTGSLHRAAWPTSQALRELAGDADPATLEVAAAVLVEIRRAKTLQKRSLRTPVTTLEVEDTAANIAALRMAEQDLLDAGFVIEAHLRPGPERIVKVELAPAEQA